MGRPAKGEVNARTRKDGLTSYSLRVTLNGTRQRIKLGTEADGWTQARAERELETVLALGRVGAWQAASVAAPAPQEASPTFHEFATAYLASRRGELRDTTYKDYEWRLVCHLLPYFAEMSVAEIDIPAVDRYRQHKVSERERIKALVTQGHDVRDARGQRVRPLSNESINKTLALLATICDVAIDHGHLTTNPARGRRRRLKAPRPKRPFLETDEARSLLAAAEELDRRTTNVSVKAAEAQRLRDELGLTFPEIAASLGVAVSHAHYLYTRATADRAEPVLIRRAIVATLIGAGLRVGELCELRWRDIDLTHARVNVRDAKTPAGVREVRLTPWLIRELKGYRASADRAGLELPAKGPAFPTFAGGFRDRKNVCERIVKKAVEVADRRREADGAGPLPEGVTPHALRCTYISMMLEAGAPLPYVMGQVGHEDESTTLGIYARVLRRKSRDALDQAFDAGFGDAPL